MKACGTCGEIKPLDEYHRQPNVRDGRQAHCKVCYRVRNATWKRDNADSVRVYQRAYRDANPERIQYLARRNRLKRYNITPEQYDSMLESQGGGCAVCGEAGKRLAVDHDHRCCPGAGHSCGKCVRAILCTQCNTALGMVNDSADRLTALLEYVGKDWGFVAQ